MGMTNKKRAINNSLHVAARCKYTYENTIKFLYDLHNMQGDVKIYSKEEIEEYQKSLRK